jgi:hypothetical protein
MKNLKKSTNYFTKKMINSLKLLTVCLLYLFLFTSGKETPQTLGITIYEKYTAFIKHASHKAEKGELTCQELDKIAQEYILDLLEIAKKRENMNEEEKASIDIALQEASKEFNVALSNEFKSYFNYAEKIKSEDYECYLKMMDYNNISMYANLDTLKKHKPSEFEKFGIALK